MKKDYNLPGEQPTYTTRRLSYETVDRSFWYPAIISVLEKSKVPLTARQIAQALYEKGVSEDPSRQAVAPRITELFYNGVIELADYKVRCEYSKKDVTAYKLRPKYKEKYKEWKERNKNGTRL